MSDEWRELPVKRVDIDFADGVMSFDATLNDAIPFMPGTPRTEAVFPDGSRLPVEIVSVSPPRAYAKPINCWEAFKERRYPRWLKAVFPVRTREWWEVRYCMVATPKSNGE